MTGDLVLDGNGARSEVSTIAFCLDFNDLPNPKGIGVHGSSKIRVDRLIRRVVDLVTIDENAAKSGNRSDDARSADTGVLVERLSGSADAIALPRLMARTSDAWITQSRLRNCGRGHRDDGNAQDERTAKSSHRSHPLARLRMSIGHSGSGSSSAVEKK